MRSCRSQENYYELSDMICVDIDIDENLASSVDALHYRESVLSTTSDLAGSVDTVELESGEQVVPVTTPEDFKPLDKMVELCFFTTRTLNFPENVKTVELEPGEQTISVTTPEEDVNTLEQMAE